MRKIVASVFHFRHFNDKHRQNSFLRSIALRVGQVLLTLPKNTKMASLKDKTASGLLWGAVNNGLTQVLNIAFGIFLARLLSPSDYGLVGMITIFTAIAGTIQESGFTSAIANKRDVKASDYDSLFWFSALMSLLLFTMLTLSAPLIAAYFRHPELIELSRVVFFTIPLSAIGVAPSAYMFKNMMVKEGTQLRVAALTASGTVGVAMAMQGWAYWSLVSQQLTYVFITSTGKYFIVPWRPSMKIDFMPVRQMFGYSCKIMLTTIINTVNQNILTVVFGRLFPARSVGEFTQANKWSTMGSALISGTTAQVMQPVFASVNDDDARQVGVVRKMMRFSAFLTFPVMFGLLIISHDFIVITLSGKWLGSVSLLQILCIGGAMSPIQQTLQTVIVSHNRSDLYMWITIAQVAIQLAIVVAFASFGIKFMVTAYVTFNVLWIGIWHIYASRIISLKMADTLKDILPFVFIAAVTMGVTWLSTEWIGLMEVRMCSRIIVAAVLYYAAMRLSHAHIMEECIGYLLHKRRKD